MHDTAANKLSHNHDFGVTNASNVKKTLNVIILTGVMMIAEIIFGIITGSMALLADGWHMATHAFALGITYFAYVMARRYTNVQKFSLGTGKFGILAAYTSALFLAATAVYMVIESIKRFVNPIAIAFNEAILVAVIGLIVNLISIKFLNVKQTVDSEFEKIQHDHNHHSHEHHDHNLRAAYLHVLADALTSILAIIALLTGKYFGWTILDPVMGIVGAVLIFRWSFGLIKSSALILLDGSDDEAIRIKIITAIQSDNDSQVIDLHVWPISSHELAAIISVVSKNVKLPSEYITRLGSITRLKHITVEVHPCEDRNCDCINK